tara:strand:- start:100 stop:204 length:105 start_codon:yes stop_codon:yes gene_type:complete
MLVAEAVDFLHTVPAEESVGGPMNLAVADRALVH